MNAIKIDHVLATIWLCTFILLMWNTIKSKLEDKRRAKQRLLLQPLESCKDQLFALTLNWPDLQYLEKIEKLESLQEEIESKKVQAEEIINSHVARVSDQGVLYYEPALSREDERKALYAIFWEQVYDLYFSTDLRDEFCLVNRYRKYTTFHSALEEAILGTNPVAKW